MGIQPGKVFKQSDVERLPRLVPRCVDNPVCRQKGKRRQLQQSGCRFGAAIPARRSTIGVEQPQRQPDNRYLRRSGMMIC